jgi:hypothetical protein
MSYKEDLLRKYAETRARLRGKSENIVNIDALLAANEAIMASQRTIADLPKPKMVGGVVAPTGVVAAENKIIDRTEEDRASYMNMLRAIAIKYRIDPELIQSEVRNSYIVSARHELWYRVRTELNYSYPRIGMLANRDHSTVLYAVEKYAKRIDNKAKQAQV